MPTPNTTKEVDEIVEYVMRMTVSNQFIYDTMNMEQKALFTNDIRMAVEEALSLLTAKHEALDPVRAGMLRQWINEDRIINNPNKKLITNKDIVFWLTPTKTDKTTDV